MNQDKPRLGSTSPARSKSARLWLIPPVILIIFILSRVLHPTHTTLTSRKLPHNYFLTEGNQTIQQLKQPFEFCPTGGLNDVLAAKYGASNLARTRIHAGSGVRVQRALRRAMSGLPVTISVLGGSISACHGAGDDPISPTCWPSLFFEWWNNVFPHPASELTNGAMRRTGSSYYAFCHSHHIPDNTDLIILDFDAADANDKASAQYFEILLRSLLIRQDNPAVVLLGHFAPQMQEQHGFGGPESIHVSIAQFYDVPHISIKPLLYPSYVSAPDSVKGLYADPILANSAGHILLADTLISYFQTQSCQVWEIAASGHFAVAETGTGSSGSGLFGGVGVRKGDSGNNAGAAGGLGSLHNNKEPNYPSVGSVLDTRPPPFLTTSRNADLHAFRELEPFCASANDLINPLPPSLFTGTGWHQWHPKGSHESLRHDGSENAHYWYSTLPTSKLKVPVRLGAGDVGIFYMEEPKGKDKRSGVKCWVDDNVRGGVEIWNIADTDLPRPALKMIDRAVAKGNHNVECILLGEEGSAVAAFKILGIFAT